MKSNQSLIQLITHSFTKVTTMGYHKEIWMDGWMDGWKWKALQHRTFLIFDTRPFLNSPLEWISVYFQKVDSLFVEGNHWERSRRESAIICNDLTLKFH